MNYNARPSRRPFNPDESEPDFLGPITPEATSFPKFPTLEEMLLHQQGTALHPLLQLTETPAPSTSPGLFQALLQDRPEALVRDALEHPEHYEEETRALLMSLAAGGRKLEQLTAGERGLLDRATIDFATAKPPTAPTRKAPAPPKPRPPVLPKDIEKDDGRAPQVETPVGPMPAYWWV